MVNKKFKDFETLLREINWNVTLKGRETLKKFNSSNTQLLCMSTLFFAKQEEPNREFTMGELAKNIDMSFSATTNLVDRLVANNLIERKRSAKDRRKVIINLSENGEILIKQVILLRQEYLQKICRNISSTEIDSLIQILTKLSDLMKKGK
ncbi:MAG: MarR family transcriptional regulator [bacterium]|nr:MarR family transcriptional regulator [bacterium]